MARSAYTECVLSRVLDPSRSFLRTLACLAALAGTVALAGCGSGGSKEPESAELSKNGTAGSTAGQGNTEAEVKQQEAEAKKREASSEAEARRRHAVVAQAEAEAASERVHKRKRPATRRTRRVKTRAVRRGRSAPSTSGGAVRTNSGKPKPVETAAEKAARNNFAREEAAEVAKIKRQERKEAAGEP
jgi:hypothetical protein